MLWKLAEQKIQEAIQQGAFENLPGFGKPLKVEDLSHLPAELRLAYRILKNSGYLPPELELRKELLTMDDLLQCCQSEERQQTLRKQRNAKLLQFELLMERRRTAPIPPHYWTRIAERLTQDRRTRK